MIAWPELAIATGRISIRSADPFAPPLIEPNSLSDPQDLKGVDVPACDRQAAGAVRDHRRGDRAGLAVLSLEETIAFIRSHATTVFHPCGTCRMGPYDGSNVVDAHLKVHGLDALRVVDASVFPNLTSGNVNAPVVMVAEKGADLILRAA